MRKTIATLCGLCLVGATLFVMPLKTEGAPAAIIFVAVVTTAVAVYDYNSCDIHIIWGCDDDYGGVDKGQNGTGGGSGGDNTSTTDVPGAQNNNGNNNGGGVPNFCTSEANSCGLTRTGTCPVTPPPVSDCAEPVFGEFSADPTLVRSGNTTNLSWEVSDATACSLNGGGLNLTGLNLSDSTESNPITSRTEFILTCFNGDAALGAPSTSQTIVVNIIPTYQEQ
jgi:hypothetical protein